MIIKKEEFTYEHEKMFDTARARKAQAEYCEKHDAPHFAPTDGKCWNCNKNIYEPIEARGYIYGITYEKAAERLVTGCPHCHRSYCD